MYRIIVFLLITANCQITHGFCLWQATDPNPIDVVIGYENFVEQWSNVEFDSVRTFKTAEDQNSRIFTREKTHLARQGNRVLLHTISLDDPMHQEDLPIVRNEITVLSTENANSLLRFSRNADMVDSALSVSTGFTDKDDVGQWTGSLESTEDPWTNFRRIPFLVDILDLKIKALIGKLKTDDLSLKNVEVAGEARPLLCVELVSNSEIDATMYFEKTDAGLVPIGLLAHKKNIETPNNIPASELSPYLMKVWAKSITYEEWLRLDGKEGVRTVTRFSTYHDGRSETTEDVTEISSLNFSVDESAFALPVSIPNGTPIFLEDSPQIKAEFRDGSVVNLYRGEVIENLASVRMASNYRGRYITALIVITLLLMAIVFWQRKKSHN